MTANKNTQWKARERKELVQLATNGKSVREMGESLNRTQKAIKAMLSELGLQVEKPAKDIGTERRCMNFANCGQMFRSKYAGQCPRCSWPGIHEPVRCSGEVAGMRQAIESARNAASVGMQLSIDHAERMEDGWADLAYAALCHYAREAKRFTSYDFRKARLIESPTTDKAFGAVFQRAARAGVIRKVGFLPHPERHCSPTPEWEACGMQEDRQ